MKHFFNHKMEPRFKNKRLHYQLAGTSYSNFETSLEHLNDYPPYLLRLLLLKLYEYEPGLIELIISSFMNNNVKIKKDRYDVLCFDLDYQFHGDPIIVKLESPITHTEVYKRKIIMRYSWFSETYIGLELSYTEHASPYIHDLFSYKDNESEIYNFKHYVFDHDNNKLECYLTHHQIDREGPPSYSGNIISISLIENYHTLIDTICKPPTPYQPKLDLKRDEIMFDEIDQEAREKVLQGRGPDFSVYNSVKIFKAIVYRDLGPKHQLFRLKGFYDEIEYFNEITGLDRTPPQKCAFLYADCDCHCHGAEPLIFNP